MCMIRVLYWMTTIWDYYKWLGWGVQGFGAAGVSGFGVCEYGLKALDQRPKESGRNYIGVSENRGPWYSTLNSRILFIRTPKKVPLIFGNSRILTGQATAPSWWCLHDAFLTGECPATNECRFTEWPKPWAGAALVFHIGPRSVEGAYRALLPLHRWRLGMNRSSAFQTKSGIAKPSLQPATVCLWVSC